MYPHCEHYQEKIKMSQQARGMPAADSVIEKCNLKINFKFSGNR